MVDAYLSPILRRYVDQVAAELGGTRLLFMQSSGGLTDARLFQGKDSILSGPAGGVVGVVRTTVNAGFQKVIGFDMGGTSTDTAHYAGEFEVCTIPQLPSCPAQVAAAAAASCLLRSEAATLHSLSPTAY